VVGGGDTSRAMPFRGDCPTCNLQRARVVSCWSFISSQLLLRHETVSKNSCWRFSSQFCANSFCNSVLRRRRICSRQDSHLVQVACLENFRDSDSRKEESDNGVVCNGADPPSVPWVTEPVAPLGSGRGGFLPYEVAFVQVGDRIWSFETGRFARQAGGAVVVRDGDTMVFCTACTETKNIKSTDFLPFRVDYFERFSSLGKTIGAYHKREGRPSDLEILISRLIDRPLRPMIAEGYFYETQVLSNVFSYDGVHLPDVLAICGCSASLALSSVPMKKTVAAVRVAIDKEDNIVINPDNRVVSTAKLDLVVSGTVDGVLMVEGGAEFVSEDSLMTAVETAHHSIVKICEAIDSLVKRAGKTKFTGKVIVPSEQMISLVDSLAGTELDDALNVFSKKERDEAIERVRAKVIDLALSKWKDSVQQDHQLHSSTPSMEEDEYLDAKLRMSWKKVLSSRMRQFILDKQIRPDGRGLDTIRPIDIIQGPLLRTHGSSLFTRGETQALVVATLGGEENAQHYETLDGEVKLRFYLQYFFPPFSVGEVGKLGPPGRREIGHGRLAERALAPIIPPREAFPYVIRVESNITESNGSSSMASVCGGCLALMEAGVPIRSPVSGVAMGLIVDGSRFAVLTDILGIEDALGDMDFKVAGNTDGVTAVQMDMKVEGIGMDILRQSLYRAREARGRILKTMLDVMPQPKPNLPASVPRICALQIPTKSIGDLIGPGGKHIRNIIEACGGEDVVSIYIGQDGLVSITSSDEEKLKRAVDMVENSVRRVEIGQEYIGKVTRILPFGMFVELFQGKEGWCHISEVGVERVESIDKIIKVGDECKVRVIEIDEKRGVRVSRRLPLLGDEVEEELEKQELEQRQQQNGEDKGKEGDSKDEQGRQRRYRSSRIRTPSTPRDTASRGKPRSPNSTYRRRTTTHMHKDNGWSKGGKESGESDASKIQKEETNQ
jgi:polyribonucleotide nucleotidyltransferase